MLNGCGCASSASVFSVFPSIDNVPIHYHRVYEHSFPKLKDLKNKGFDVFKYSKMEGCDYETKRLVEEKEHFLEMLKISMPIVCDNGLFDFQNLDDISVDIALVSHLYFDTFNNPVQAFVPDNVYCSAQWDFWKSINYDKYRIKLADKSFLRDFRAGLANLEVWRRKIETVSVIKSMAIRLVEQMVPPQSVNCEMYLKALNSKVCFNVNKESLNNALEFCHSCENQIAEMIRSLL